MVTFSDHHPSPRTRLVRHALQFQIMAVATFLVIYRAHLNILFVVKVKVFVLVKWSHRPPQSHQLLNLEQLIHFEHVIQSFVNKCPFGVRSWMYNYPNTTQI